MTSSDTRFTGLPSWCPNFSSGIETHRIMMIEYRAGWPRDSALSSAAAGNAAIRSRAMFKGKWANHERPPRLLTRSRCGAVSSTLSKNVAKHNPIVRGTKGLFVPELLSWLNEILDMARKLPHASDEELPDSYWRTLVGDFDSITAAFPAAPAHIERCRLLSVAAWNCNTSSSVLVGSLEPMKPELARLMADKSWQSSFDNYVFQPQPNLVQPDVLHHCWRPHGICVDTRQNWGFYLRSLWRS